MTRAKEVLETVRRGRRVMASGRFLLMKIMMMVMMLVMMVVMIMSRRRKRLMVSDNHNQSG